MTAYALLFTLAAIGISETAYLIRQRSASERPVCPIGGGCHVVLESKYGRLFLIPNDVVGMIGYILIAITAAFLVIGVEPVAFWWRFMKALVTVATLLSLVLVYLQWRVIRAWCFWCILSACTIWLMAIIIIYA